MKKLVLINILLIIIIYKIPLQPKDVEIINTANNISVETSIKEEDNKQNEIQITNRGQEEKREIIKNLYLDVNSNLTVISNLKAEDYEKMLKGTNLQGIGLDLEEAEKINGVNGLYLMGLACLESAYGNSNFAKQRNNLVGWNAVDSNPNKATYFKSKGECIRFVAHKLKINYLTPNGPYFEGYSATAVDKHYCTDKKHAQKIINIVNKLERKL